MPTIDDLRAFEQELERALAEDEQGVELRDPLERIAAAMERIASALERQGRPVVGQMVEVPRPARPVWGPAGSWGTSITSVNKPSPR